MYIHLQQVMRNAAVICMALFIFGVNGDMMPTVELNFLRGVHRLFSDAKYTDFYFACMSVGTSIQWHANGESLSEFKTTETGQVYRGVTSKYNYTSTLLSSQPTHQSNLMVLDSIIVVSFEKNSPNFEITCLGNNHSKTISLGDITDSDPTHDGTIAFQYLFSSRMVLSQTYVHVFICSASSALLFSGDVGPTIAFTAHDHIGQSRTAFESDHNSIQMLGILMARVPQSLTSLFFIAMNGTASVKCFSEKDEITLSSVPSLPLQQSTETRSVAVNLTAPGTSENIASDYTEENSNRNLSSSKSKQ